MAEINKNSLKLILNSLNDELKSREISREIRVFGSGALMLLDLSKEARFTLDLDMLSPTGDMDLLRASKMGGKTPACL